MGRQGWGRDEWFGYRAEARVVRGMMPLEDVSTTAETFRNYVHQSAAGRAFPVECRRVAEDEFLVRMRWPAAYPGFLGHAFPDGAESLVWAEAVRQAGLLLAHAEYGVPLGWSFLMKRLTAVVVPGREGTGGEVEARVVARNVQRRGAHLTGMEYDVQFRAGEELLGSGRAQFSCLPPPVYRRLRGAAVDASPPRRAGVVEDRLLDGDDPWMLDVDGRHPGHFDHHVDHVPGMVLLEAARQAACALTALRDVGTIDAQFHRYVEFDPPCSVTARVVAPGDVAVVGEQRGAETFTARLGLV